MWGCKLECSDVKCLQWAYLFSFVRMLSQTSLEFPQLWNKVTQSIIKYIHNSQKNNITYRLQTFRNKNSTYCKALMVIGKLQEDLEHLTLPQHQLAKITSKSSSTEQVVKLNMSLSKLHVQAVSYFAYIYTPSQETQSKHKLSSFDWENWSV